MKIKEVSAGVKISKNYNSYSVNLAADINEDDDYKSVGEILIKKAEEMINKKLANNKDDKKAEEVGAAWYSKDFPGKLSAQYSKGGPFIEIEIKELEKQEFKQIVNGKTFVFRRIPLEKRKNSKMPVFRIYREEKNE